MLSKVRSQVRRTGLGQYLDAKTLGVVVIALLLAGLAFRYRHLLRPKRGLAATKAQTQTSSDSEEVVRLYRDLEALMQAHGVPRRAETPPLAHALGLKALEHPLADDIVELTRIYLAVRFGRAPLSSEQATDFQHRVKAMHQLPPPKAA
jgi:hypothetical protein